MKAERRALERAAKAPSQRRAEPPTMAGLSRDVLALHPVEAEKPEVPRRTEAAIAGLALPLQGTPAKAVR